MGNKIKKFLLLLGDISSLYLSLYLTLFLRYSTKLNVELWQLHFLPFTLIFIIWIVIFYVSELYNLNFAVNNRRFYGLSFRSFFIGGLISILFFYLLPQTQITPKTNLALFVGIFAIIFFMWRNLFNLSIKSWFPKENLMIIGYNEQTKELISEIDSKPHLGFKISFILISHKQNVQLPNKIETCVFNNINGLKKMISDKKITTLILANDPIHSEELSSILFNCLSLRVNFINLPTFYENITGKVPIDIINRIWFLENLTEGKKRLFDFFKRISDILMSSIILLVSFPFWMIIALIIKSESKGKVFFKQIRAGKNAAEFTIIKFRSMKMESNDFSPTQKDDDRITKFGSFLRKTRIDEIPQIINVLKGEMSFVGPRPERSELIIELEKNIPFYKERMLIKPGITGWDQVSTGYHSPSYEDTIEKLQYDLYYIKNRSVYLDISIILKTFSTILSKSGR